MPFVYENDNVISFAEFQDVLDRDQRLFDANEGLTDDVIDPLLVRGTQRLLSKIKSSAWWKERNYPSIPDVNPDLIINRQGDFTDLCVYQSLTEYILPIVADFGKEDNAERQKMFYYTQKAEALFIELITSGDWYDFDESGTISDTEIKPGNQFDKRIR